MNDPVRPSLSHVDEEQFANALLSAFPKVFKLKQLLWYRLGRNLDDFVPEQSDREVVVFELIQEASAGGWWPQLLQAARHSQPQNSLLLEFGQQRGLALAPSGVSAPAPALVAPAPATSHRSGFLDTGVLLARLGEIEGRVCRVEADRSLGTGFLIGPDIVMTSFSVAKRVIEGGLSPDHMVFRFDYRKSSDGATINAGTEYRLAASDWLILSSPYSPFIEETVTDEAPDPDHLDFALLRLDRAAGLDPLGGWGEPGAQQRGWIAVPKNPPEVAAESQLHMVQHPLGDPLKVQSGVILGAQPAPGPTHLRYRVETEPGSAGSPCFDHQWQLVAMHQRRLFNTQEPESRRFTDEREGVLLGPILRHLACQFLAGELVVPSSDAMPADLAPAEPQPMVRPDRQKTERIMSALISAFDMAQLHSLATLELGLNLETISPPNENFETTAFNLVQWAEAQGQLTHLLHAARRLNPYDPELLALVDSIDQ